MQLQTWLLYTLAAGGVPGFTLLIALSMFGIAALLESSIIWLTVLKWVGGGLSRQSLLCGLPALPLRT